MSAIPRSFFELGGTIAAGRDSGKPAGDGATLAGADLSRECVQCGAANCQRPLARSSHAKPTKRIALADRRAIALQIQQYSKSVSIYLLRSPASGDRRLLQDRSLKLTRASRRHSAMSSSSGGLHVRPAVSGNTAMLSQRPRPAASGTRERLLSDYTLVSLLWYRRRRLRPGKRQLQPLLLSQLQF